MNQEVELRHMRYFLAVAETLHFGRAAEMLGISQPPLSQQIKNLENILGHPLFDRTTRGVKLTRVGQYFAERARGILTILQDDIAGVKRLGEGQEGILKVGITSSSVMLTHLPKAIRRYRTLHPRVELRLREDAMDVQISALQTGALDLGFIRDGAIGEGLYIETIEREPFVAILPVHHRLARKTKIDPSELKDEPFVLFDRALGSVSFDRIVAICNAAGFSPDIVQEAPQWPTIVQLIVAGLGITLAPACIARFAMPGVVYKKLFPSGWSTIDVVRKLKLGNPAAADFLALVFEEFATKRVDSRQEKET